MLIAQFHRRNFIPIVLPTLIFAVLILSFPANRHRFRTVGNRLKYDSHKQDVLTEWLGTNIGHDIQVATSEDASSVEISSKTPLSEVVSPGIVFTTIESDDANPPDPVASTKVDQDQPIQQLEDEPKQVDSSEEQQAVSLAASAKDFARSTFVKAIMDHESTALERLPCSNEIGARYKSLRRSDGKIHYFFALDLHAALALLPTLLGSIIHTIRFLGPTSCTLSIIEGRSTDGTPEVLVALRTEIEAIGATYHHSTSDIDPKDGVRDRTEALAALRNAALLPLIQTSEKYSKDASIIFLNDIGICSHDILELLYQHTIQQAYMTCGMDWSGLGEIFYDIFVARSLVGETFWQIAQDGLWKFTQNLFWADRTARRKYEAHQPFQVYACWNGGAILNAAPVMEQRIAFRRNNVTEDECYMGEPTLFCKDLWRLKLGRIQVVPTVNVGYGDPLNATEQVKNSHGWLEDYIDVEREEPQVEMIEWQKEPPSLVKCMTIFHEPYWVPST
ncbi:MAG: hypothetical protein M1812_007679 [Candelaria pacifica]|nr:MAG: hypothetical protein M1812_007679 [Candelaria pacifica]